VSALPENATDASANRCHAFLATHVPAMTDPIARIRRLRVLAIPAMQMSVTTHVPNPPESRSLTGGAMSATMEA
jgi:hypothetical protein